MEDAGSRALVDEQHEASDSAALVDEQHVLDDGAAGADEQHVLDDGAAGADEQHEAVPAWAAEWCLMFAGDGACLVAREQHDFSAALSFFEPE